LKKKKKFGENPDKLQNDQVRTGTRAPSSSKQPSILGFFFVFFVYESEEKKKY
jgi:hypothetical protein